MRWVIKGFALVIGLVVVIIAALILLGDLELNHFSPPTIRGRRTFFKIGLYHLILLQFPQSNRQIWLVMRQGISDKKGQGCAKAHLRNHYRCSLLRHRGTPTG